MSPPKDHHHHSASLGEALPPLHPVAGSVLQRETEDPLVSGTSLLSLRDTECLRKLCEARGGDKKQRARTSYRPEETRSLQVNIQNPRRNSPHAPAARAATSRYPPPKTAVKHTLPPTGNKSSGLSLREHRLDVLTIKRSIFWHGWVRGKPHFQSCLPPRNVAGWCPSPFTSGDHSCLG